MDTIELRAEIDKMEAALAGGSIPESVKPDIEAGLETAKDKLAKLEASDDYIGKTEAILKKEGHEDIEILSHEIKKAKEASWTPKAFAADLIEKKGKKETPAPKPKPKAKETPKPKKETPPPPPPVKKAIKLSHKEKVPAELLKDAEEVHVCGRVFQLQEDTEVWFYKEKDYRLVKKGEWIMVNKAGKVVTAFDPKSKTATCEKPVDTSNMVKKETHDALKAKFEEHKTNSVTKATNDKAKEALAKTEEKLKNARAESQRLRKLVKESGGDPAKAPVAVVKTEIGIPVVTPVVEAAEKAGAAIADLPVIKPVVEVIAEGVAVVVEDDNKVPKKDDKIAVKKEGKEADKATKKEEGKAEPAKRASCNIKRFKGEPPATLIQFLVGEVEEWKAYEVDKAAKNKGAQVYKVMQVYMHTETGAVVVKRQVKSTHVWRVWKTVEDFHKICLEKGTLTKHEKVKHNMKDGKGAWKVLVNKKAVAKMYSSYDNVSQCALLAKEAYELNQKVATKPEAKEKYKEHYNKCGDQKSKALARDYGKWMSDEAKDLMKEEEGLSYHEAVVKVKVELRKKAA